MLAPPNDIKKASRLADWVVQKLEKILEELADFDTPQDETSEKKNGDGPG